MTERVAIYPGSFDPLTDGHLSIIRRAARLFHKLIVVVGYNPNKKTLFPLEERLALIRQETSNLPNVTVDSFTGELLVSYATRVGANIVVRGLRNEADFRNEFRQSKMNHLMKPDLETVFILSDREDIFVSSTIVRNLIQEGGNFAPFVPDAVEKLTLAEGNHESK